MLGSPNALAFVDVFISFLQDSNETNITDVISSMGGNLFLFATNLVKLTRLPLKPIQLSTLMTKVQWGRHLQKKMLEVSDEEIPNASSGDWSNVRTAFRLVADLNQQCLEDLATYQLGFRHNIFRKIGTVTQAGLLNREHMTVMKQVVPK